MPRIRAENIERHKAQTRAAILGAAADAFHAHGIDATSIGSIADLAGLPRSTLYDYFPNKRAVLAAVVGERIPPLVEVWQAELPTDDPRARLEAMFDAALRASEANPALAAIVLGAGRTLPVELRHDLVPLVATVLKELKRVYEWGVAEGVFVAADADAVASALGDLLAGGVEDLLGRSRPALPLEVVQETRLELLRRILGVADG
jgi:AcrR family transcriptional regulator